MEKDLTFIILTWNSSSYIDNCIESIFSALDQTKLKYDINIIDNGSKDSTIEKLNFLQKEYPDLIRTTLLDRNMGTTYSRNLALSKADAKYVCIMDSDVELSYGCIPVLIRKFELNPLVGLLAPAVFYPDGRLQKSVDDFPTVARKFLRYLFLREIEKKESEQHQPESIREVDYAISAFWLISRSAVKKVGLLDEIYFYAPEDADYCMRIWKAGYKVVYDTSVSVIHHTQEISRGVKFNKAFYEHLKGLMRFFLKYQCFINSPNFKNR